VPVLSERNTILKTSLLICRSLAVEVRAVLPLDVSPAGGKTSATEGNREKFLSNATVITTGEV
jgi:hypothetical protein